MIAIIRIKGLADTPKKEKRTLHILKLRRKYACVIVEETPIIKGMVKRIIPFIAFGEITKETAKKLLEKRGKLEGDKPLKMNEEEIEKIIEDIFNKKKKLEDFKIKPFFRLHPPRGGFKKGTKLMYPAGALGKNEKINQLIERML